ncbi:MAG: CoA-transferase subunit beta [Christensenellales bacterium]
MIRPADMMSVALSRLIRDGETVFQGVSSHLPLVAILLAKRLHAPQAVHLNIPGGVDPKALSPSRVTSAGSELLAASRSEFPLADVFDLSMRGGLDLAFLSGVQFDSRGGVNASLIGDPQKPRVRLPGGAGSAVLVPTARRVVLWRSRHDKRTFVQKLDFLTARGNVSDIITPLCHFTMHGGELILKSVHPGVSIEDVAANTGFPIRYLSLEITPPPSAQELSALREVDPRDLRSLEFREARKRQ